MALNGYESGSMDEELIPVDVWDEYGKIRIHTHKSDTKIFTTFKKRIHRAIKYNRGIKFL